MNSDQKKIILVFGGSGLLGVHCHQVLNKNYKVILTYKTNQIFLDKAVSFNALDTSEILDNMLKEYQPDIIINALALVTVDGCESDPILAKKLNEGFVDNLVFSMEKNNLVKTHLIQISSDSVYGQTKSSSFRPWVETDPLNPLSVYASTKLNGEIAAQKHSGPVTVLRTAFYGINPFSTKSLLWWIMDNAKKGNEMEGWENIFFSPISATSLVKIISKIINKSVTGCFNIGSTNSCNKFDFVEAVCDLIGHSTKVKRTTQSPFDRFQIRPEYTVLDVSKLSKIIPIQLDWRDDLSDYIKNKDDF